MHAPCEAGDLVASSVSANRKQQWRKGPPHRATFPFRPDTFTTKAGVDFAITTLIATLYWVEVVKFTSKIAIRKVGPVVIINPFSIHVPLSENVQDRNAIN
ncbi:MAG: hypothetical protein HKN47_02085 [Pirellulaceae bacterium]|nr:hypothetical protein [Pirellulaceae bacterium]